MKIAVTSRTLSNTESFVRQLHIIFGKRNVKLNKNNDGLKDDKLIKFLKDQELVVLGTEPLHSHIIESLPKLKEVFKYGVGIDNIDFKFCEMNSIKVHYKKGTNNNAVAEITLSYIIQLLRNQHLSSNSTSNGNWNKTIGKELSESKVGILGLGNVGEVVMNNILNISSCQVLMSDRKYSISPWISPEELFALSDLVTIHIDNELMENNNFIGNDLLNLLKDGAYLVNTARGSILDYEALEQHLPRLGGIALDVYPNEPEIPSFLINNEKVILSSHICGSSELAIKNGQDFIINEIEKHLGINHD